ncbi:MAG: TIGR04086 family membrane protein [Clostridia bacterium]|nr:TIGR04086 family membrane protein [Clostridia bacterium]
MQKDNSYGNRFFSVLKGAALSLALSLLFSIIFACILRATTIPRKAIYPINQTAKGILVTIGALAFVRGEKGWLQGGGIGLLFTAFSYLAFSAIGGDFSLSWLILLELLIAFSTGALGGILAVNLKK